MPPPDRPVRLTFPSYDIGAARIMAGDLQVGHVWRGDRCWTAWLWNETGNRQGGHADAPVTREYLRELRARLRERVELNGPWWSG